MSRLDRFAAIILVVALVLVAAAMAVPNARSYEPAVSLPPTAEPYREGVLGHPSSITPLTARTQADRDLVKLIFRGLVREGPNGTLLPDLARSWTISPDGKTYTFLLRTDAYWEDGEPVTSSDVAFTVGLVQSSDYDGPLGASWDGISVVAESTYVVHFELTTPLGGFLRQASLPLLPDHLLHGISASELADSDFSSQPLGNGAFQLLEVDEAHAVLERVRSGAPAQEQPDTATESPTATATPGLPVPESLGEVDLRFFDDPAEMAAEFEAGHLDAVGGLSSELTAQAATRSGSRVVSYPWAMLTGVVLNQRTAHPELRDANVRLALLGAIDRKTLVGDVLGDQGTVADVPYAAWSPWYDEASVTPVAFDRTAARSHLALAGWTETAAGWASATSGGGYTIKLLTPDEATDPLLYRAAVAVVADWRAIDLDAKLEPLSAVDYLDRLTSGDFTAAIADFQLGLDPDLSPLLLSSQAEAGGPNVSGYQDATLDRLLKAARMDTDPSARLKAVLAVEKSLSTNVPILPVCFRDYSFVVSERVGGLTNNQVGDPSGRYWDVIDWRLASGG